MKKVRFIFTLWLVKFSIVVGKLMRKNATNYPGILAQKLCPDFLKLISKPKKIIGVTGTNGKTTVCNILDDFFLSVNVPHICNRTGSNIYSGIITTFISGVNLFNKTKVDLAILEIDERSANKVFPYFSPDYLVINNLFRDSLSRNAHTEFISNFLTYYIPKKTKLILNGNDMIVSTIAKENDRIYFGIDKLKNEIEIRNNIVCDMKICPNCGHELIYDYIRYNHIGFCHCPKCDFKNPPIDYLITDVDYNKNKIKLSCDKEEVYDCKFDNIINIYNILAVITLLKELGYDHDIINNQLKSINIVKSRYEILDINNYKIISILSKGLNPIACSRAFSYVKNFEGNKNVILVLDDQHVKKESSENIAWYYDTDFEFLNDKSINKIMIGGTRCYDIYNRLLLAGIDKNKLILSENELTILDNIDITDTENIFILHDLYSLNIKKELINIITKKIGRI